LPHRRALGQDDAIGFLSNPEQIVQPAFSLAAGTLEISTERLLFEAIDGNNDDMVDTLGREAPGGRRQSRFGNGLAALQQTRHSHGETDKDSCEILYKPFCHPTGVVDGWKRRRTVRSPDTESSIHIGVISFVQPQCKAIFPLMTTTHSSPSRKNLIGFSCIPPLDRAEDGRLHRAAAMYRMIKMEKALYHVSSTDQFKSHKRTSPARL
jgi:hypothetical protein